MLKSVGDVRFSLEAWRYLAVLASISIVTMLPGGPMMIGIAGSSMFIGLFNAQVITGVDFINANAL